jgi:hypothetical protein
MLFPHQHSVHHRLLANKKFQFHVDFKLKIFYAALAVARDTFSIKNNDSWIDGDFSAVVLLVRNKTHNNKRSQRESSLNWLSENFPINVERF